MLLTRTYLFYPHRKRHGGEVIKRSFGISTSHLNWRQWLTLSFIKLNLHISFDKLGLPSSVPINFISKTVLYTTEITSNTTFCPQSDGGKVKEGGGGEGKGRQKGKEVEKYTYKTRHFSLNDRNPNPIPCGWL